MEPGRLILVVGGILLASVVAASIARKAGVPVLVAFLGLGMLLGSDGVGGIEFDDAHLARTVGIVGLAIILFAAVFSTLRVTRLRRRLARVLEAESGANDPVAVA